MASYGDLAAIKQLLAVTGTVYDANTTARLTSLNASISGLFEDAVGRTFGAPGTGSARLVWARGTSMLILPGPAWAITSVTVDGDVLGDQMTGGVTLTPGDYVTGISDSAGQIYALHWRYGGCWAAGSPVWVTATWADADKDANVPNEVVTAVNKLTVEHFKAENLPAVTEDGVIVPRRDPWEDPFVVRVIRKYRISSRELVV